MKFTFFITLLLFLANTSFAQDSLEVAVADNDQEVKLKLLDNLNKERKKFQDDLSNKIDSIDNKITKLDQVINSSKSQETKLNTLLERVQILETKQRAQEEKAYGVYKYNYSSAIINLSSMEREIKPLDLFNSSRDFFGALEEVGNPMQYEGFQEWFGKVKSFIDAKKDLLPQAGALSHLLNVTGDLSKGTPFTGPLTTVLFQGINLFIGQIGKKEKALKTKSLNMYKLAVSISQFTHDKNLIETEWDEINKSLEELKKLQEEAIQSNIVDILGISITQFENKFTKQTDANKRFEFIKHLTDLIDKEIAAAVKKNPKKWKEDFHQQLQSVQSLKVRFGTITFRILENIKKYEALILKYKKDPYMGEKVSDLEEKLFDLKDIFESTFNPQQYIKAANSMYVVE